MEKVIVSDNQGNYFFLDDPEWGADVAREDAVMVLDSETAAGYHYCHRSALYDDMTDYRDGLQAETALPDGTYCVSYYFYPGQSDPGADLYQLVDWQISKEQLVANAASGKYVEGAEYYLLTA